MARTTTALQQNSSPRVLKRKSRVIQERAPAFIEPMLCLLVNEIPAGEGWEYEVKWDGYRAQGIKHGTKCQLMSRNRKSLGAEFPTLTKALLSLRCKSAVVDGEVVAFGEDGRPAFQLLQNRKSRPSDLRLVLFDALQIDSKDLTGLSLEERRKRLKAIMPRGISPLAFSGNLHGSPDELEAAARATGLEGIIAKRRSSVYEPGDRTGAWVKFKTEEEGTFVIGGYLPDGKGAFEELIIGQREKLGLRYMASMRAGFVSLTKRKVMDRIIRHATTRCPFFDLPETGKARWGRSLDAEKMKECRWVKPRVKVEVAFVERTESGKLRHSRFVRLP